LLVRLCNWVGEAVLSLPTLRRLEAVGFELHLYGKGWAPSLFAGTGWPVTVRRGGVFNAVTQLRRLRATLSNSERALLMTKSFSSALEMRLAGFSPSGYARDGRSFLLDQSYARQRFAHAADEYWYLADRFLGVAAAAPPLLGWNPSEAQRAQALALLAERHLDDQPFILLCPFSGTDDREDRKVWPGFKALAEKLSAAGTPVVLCPGPGEEVAAAALSSRAVSLPGVDLGVYGALMQTAQCVVANDTGPGHLAAASGARLVSIYGPHSVAAWTPIGPHVQLFHDAAGWPKVEQVLTKVSSGFV
jgi:heptosyltransferase-2